MKHTLFLSLLCWVVLLGVLQSVVYQCSAETNTNASTPADNLTLTTATSGNSSDASNSTSNASMQSKLCEQASKMIRNFSASCLSEQVYCQTLRSALEFLPAKDSSVGERLCESGDHIQSVMRRLGLCLVKQDGACLRQLVDQFKSAVKMLSTAATRR